MFFNHYNTRDILWLGDWSMVWIIALVAIGLVVFSLSFYDLRNLSRYKRWFLLSLRAVIYGIAILMLLEPAIDLKNVSKVKNHVAILVDDSQSMALRTTYESKTRHELSQLAIQSLKPLVERPNDDHHFHFYRFGKTLQSATASSFAQALPTEQRTDIGQAIEDLNKLYRDRELGGVVLLSDGIDTAAIGQRTRRNETLDNLSNEIINALDAPINTINIGNSKGMKDVAIARVRHDDFAFVHNKLEIEVQLQVVGMDATSIPVNLYRDGHLLQTRHINVDPNTIDYSIHFEFVPQQVGKELYTVMVPEHPDEALYENNAHHFMLRVIRDKIRVLQVVGRPSWDQRFLRQMLKSNPNVDLISFFILRTNANVQTVNPDELSLIPFPTDELFRDELGSFDLVIFQNFNFGPYNMRQYLPSIENFVMEGGGFIMVGGDLSFANGGYANTPVERILPVNLPAVNGAKGLDTRDFNPNLTDAGHRHPITQLAFDPDTNAQIWQNLPPLRGTNIVGESIPNATVLATHPTLTYAAQPMPVIAVSEMGEGRVMALTSDSTWRWGFSSAGTGGTSHEYQSFWNSAIRWLIKDPELKLLRAELGADIYEPGDQFEATIRAFSPDYTPAQDVSGTVDITFRSLDSIMSNQPSQAEIIVSKEFQTDHHGQSKLSHPVNAAGIYEIQARAETSSGSLVDATTFLALQNTREFRDILPREALMESIAQTSGGHYFPTHEFDTEDLIFKEPGFVQVNERKVIQLWDSALLFFVILGLLTVEWTMRRRWGRL